MFTVDSWGMYDDTVSAEFPCSPPSGPSKRGCQRRAKSAARCSRLAQGRSLRLEGAPSRTAWRQGQFFFGLPTLLCFFPMTENKWESYIPLYTSIRWDGHQSSIHRNLYMQQWWKNWILMASGPQQYPGHRLRWRGPCLGCRGAWGWVDPSNTYRMSWACSVSKWLLGS